MNSPNNRKSRRDGMVEVAEELLGRQVTLRSSKRFSRERAVYPDVPTAIREHSNSPGDSESSHIGHPRLWLGWCGIGQIEILHPTTLSASDNSVGVLTVAQTLKQTGATISSEAQPCQCGAKANAVNSLGRCPVAPFPARVLPACECATAMVRPDMRKNSQRNAVHQAQPANRQ